MSHLFQGWNKTSAWSLRWFFEALSLLLWLLEKICWIWTTPQTYRTMYRGIYSFASIHAGSFVHWNTIMLSHNILYFSAKHCSRIFSSHFGGFAFTYHSFINFNHLVINNGFIVISLVKIAVVQCCFHWTDHKKKFMLPSFEIKRSSEPKSTVWWNLFMRSDWPSCSLMSVSF